MLRISGINIAVGEGMAVLNRNGHTVGHPIFFKKWGYPIIALDEFSDLPSNEEFRLIRECVEFTIRRDYGPNSELLREDIPHHIRHDTLILIKGGLWPVNEDDGWAFRLRSWSKEPQRLFVPNLSTQLPETPWNLNEVLCTAVPGWREYKEGKIELPPARAVVCLEEGQRELARV